MIPLGYKDTYVGHLSNERSLYDTGRTGNVLCVNPFLTRRDSGNAQAFATPHEVLRLPSGCPLILPDSILFPSIPHAVLQYPRILGMGWMLSTPIWTTTAQPTSMPTFADKVEFVCPFTSQMVIYLLSPHIFI